MASEPSEGEEAGPSDMDVRQMSFFIQEEAGASAPSPAGAARSANKLVALDGIRFFAAAHISGYHLAIQRGRTSLFDEEGLLRFATVWAESWVPFFFVLSGFVLTYSQLGKEDFMNVGPLGKFMRKRWLSVYPLYVLSIVQVCTMFGFLRPPTVSWWLSVPYDVLLIQTWFPQVPDTAPDPMAWNGNAWFLSTLNAMWLLFPFMYRIVARLSVRHCLGGLCCTFAASVLWPIFFYLRPEHYHLHSLLGFASIFHPLSNLHQFLSGMLLGRLFKTRSTMSDVHMDLLGFSCGRSGRRSRCGCSATLSICALLALFVFCRMEDFGYGVWPRLGLLLPLHWLLIWGLASEEDPVAYLFKLPPLSWSGQYAYALYILQPFGNMVGYSLVLHFFDKEGRLPLWQQFLFFDLVFQILAAVAALHLVDRPIQARLK